MALSELLDGNLVLLKNTSASKYELITELLGQIYKTGREPPFPFDEVHGKIFLREEIGGTLLPSGLSVPHARLVGYEGFVLAVGTTVEPLFHNGIQIRLMALMLSSQSGGQYYLSTLAALTKLSRDGEYFSRLCSSQCQDDFIKIIRERD